MDASLIQTIAVYALPVIFAITLHEAAHGYAARLLGDNTAYMMGRVSFNPMRHIDPLGTTLILPPDDEPLNDPEDIRARLEKQVDLVIDGGACPREPSTVIDLTGDEPELVRAGRGALEPFGLSAP